MMDQGARLSLQESALEELLTALGLTFDASKDPRVERFAEQQPLYPQFHRIGHKRQLAFQALTGDRRPAREHYASAFRALVHDDDLNSPRFLAQALAAGVGRQRVAEDLIRAVEQGSPYEQGCAVGAWRWVEASPGGDERFRAACREARATCEDPWTLDRSARSLVQVADRERAMGTLK